MSVCFSRFWMDHIQDGPFWVAYGRGGGGGQKGHPSLKPVTHNLQ